MSSQLTEARAFEMLGRLHAENRLLADEVSRLEAAGRQTLAALEATRAELDALKRDVPEPADEPQPLPEPRRKGR